MVIFQVHSSFYLSYAHSLLFTSFLPQFFANVNRYSFTIMISVFPVWKTLTYLSHHTCPRVLIVPPPPFLPYFSIGILSVLASRRKQRDYKELPEHREEKSFDCGKAVHQRKEAIIANFDKVRFPSFYCSGLHARTEVSYVFLDFSLILESERVSVRVLLLHNSYMRILWRYAVEDRSKLAPPLAPNQAMASLTTS